MTITNKVSLRSVESGITPIDDVPDAPTIGAATNVGTSRAYNNGSATVAYTAAATGGTATTFTATSTPGSFTATGASPITVTGLQSATSYTFTVTPTNSTATGPASSASSSITATTVPQAPTIGTASVATGQSYTGSANTSVTFTPGATGGASATYTVTSSSGNTGTGSSSPITVSETVGNPTSTARTYTVTATNANGTTAASSASNSVTPASVPQAPTIGTATAGNTSATVTYTANATGGAAVTTYTATSSPGGFTGTGASPITVSGLTNGTAYTFTVRATNSQGTSAASSASNSVTPVLPALGAWSVSTNIPSTSISDQQGNGNGSFVWVGGGIFNGSDVSSVGYKWNGSSWSSSNTEIPIYQQIVQRLTASGSSNSLMRIVGYTSGFATTSTTAIYNGTSWSNSATFPRQTLGVGFASLDGTGNVRTVGGDSLGGRYTYYQTSFGGAWTQNGIDSPILNAQLATGVDNNFGGKGWFWRQNTADAYECTSTTSAWTTLTSAPWGAFGNDFYVNATVVNGTVMVAPQYNSSPQGGTIYTFNGTTYTVQTSMSGNVSNWNRTTIGAISNVISYIRNDSSPNANQSYHWRATFA